MSFFEELKRRNVFRVGAAYAVAAWILLQALDVVGEILELPPWGGKLILVLVVVGFFLALFFAWAFELTPEGIKREHEVDRSQSITPQTGRKLDRTIIVLLVLALAYFVWESRFMEREAGTTAAESAVTTSEEAAVTELPRRQEVGDGAPAAQAPEPPSAPPVDPRSIAVLPFANRSLQEEDLFFTEGIHDDLLTQLAKIRDLKVISRTSVMKYKDAEKTIPEIAQELQVATILEGGVQRAGQRIRINAQLIDVANDQHLWAETFDREMTVENIFDIQSEITRQIVQAVRGEMTEEERANLARIPTNNLEAYEAYLQALALTNRADYSQQNYIEAQFWTERAVELDREFAQAWAMLVEIHGQANWLGYDTSAERLEAARQALENAERYGPDLAETIAARAEYQYRIEQDFRKAAATFGKAHEALPGDVDILHRLAVAQRRTPDVEGALRSFEKAMELDPQHSRSPSTLAETLVGMDRLEEAAHVIDRAILKFPDARDLRAARINVHRGRGDLDMAEALFDNLTPWAGPAYVQLAVDMPFFQRDFERAIAVWDQPEVAELAQNRGWPGFREASTAWAYRLLGQEETARAEALKGIEAVTAATPVDSYVYAFEIAFLAMNYALAGEPELAVAAADRAARMVPEEKDQMFGVFVAMTRAQVLAMAGERDAALREIERLLTTPYRFNKWLLHLDSRWDFFRDDERFNELVRPEGAPETLEVRR